MCEGNDCYYKQLQRLKQENKTLNYQWHKQAEIGDEWYKVAENYRSAFKEIKNSVINYLPKENYKFTRSFNPEKFELLENILTKINEVLNG